MENVIKSIESMGEPTPLTVAILLALQCVVFGALLWLAMMKGKR